MEELDEAGSGSDLDRLTQTELALISTTPGVQIASVGHNHGVAVTAGNHGDAFVTERLEDLGLLRSK